eukprot:2028950-Rhodomonas_salina.3
MAVSAYACDTRCPVLTERMVLQGDMPALKPSDVVCPAINPRDDTRWLVLAYRGKTLLSCLRVSLKYAACSTGCGICLRL